MKPKICVISGSRAEYGLLKNVILPLEDSNLLDKYFIVTGSHLSARHGETINEIKKDNIKIDEEIAILKNDDTSSTITTVISDAIINFSRSFEKLKPDLVLILGDRYEIFSVAIAAMINNIPIAHIHGGESTEAAIDESIRHSLTKMSYFHFVAAEEYKNRVIQLGENPKRVFLVGGLGIDSIKNNNFYSKEELEAKYKIKFREKSLAITIHPVTLEQESNQKLVEELLAALDGFSETTIIFTLPNADVDGDLIAKKIISFSQERPNCYYYESLGHKGYLSLLKNIDGVVGNSSSGIMEAPFCGVGTVNIGDRQTGRIKAESIVDVSVEKRAIVKGINQIMSTMFRRNINKQVNPYGNGDAGRRIIEILEKQMTKKNNNFLKKEFFDIEKPLYHNE